MQYSVEFSEEALEQLEKLPRREQRAVDRECQRLCGDLQARVTPLDPKQGLGRAHADGGKLRIIICIQGDTITVARVCREADVLDRTVREWMRGLGGTRPKG